jgi:hypothetical protein
MSPARLRPLLAFASLALLANSSPDAFSSALAALKAGVKAESNGSDSALRRAGARLSATGARPLERSADLAREWRRPGPQNSAETFRNRALGPAYRRLTLNKGSTAHFEQVFLAGQRARVAIVPVNNAAFGLQVADDTGQSMCNSRSAKGQCDWVPLYTSRYSIDLRNHSERTASYVLVMQ